jgi:hypothetical protein
MNILIVATVAWGFWSQYSLELCHHGNCAQTELTEWKVTEWYATKAACQTRLVDVSQLFRRENRRQEQQPGYSQIARVWLDCLPQGVRPREMRR